MSKRVFIEVLPTTDGRWFYHEKGGGRIKNASQAYTRKSSAKRAGMREAWEQGCQVKIYDKNGHLQYILDYAEIRADAELH